MKRTIQRISTVLTIVSCALMAFQAFQPFLSAAPVAPPVFNSVVYADYDVEAIEASFDPQMVLDPNSSTLTQDEKNILAYGFLNGQAEVNFVDANVVPAIQGFTIDVPALAITHNQLQSVLGFMAQTEGAYTPEGMAYVVCHWTNHCSQVGIPSTNVGQAAAYVQNVIRLAVNGQGIMFWRPATEQYQESYFLAARVNGRLWGQWLDSTGRPITGYLANQKSLDSLTLKYARDGFVQIFKEEDLPALLRARWLTGVPPVWRFYVWGLQRIMEEQMLIYRYTAGQALGNMAAASMRFGGMPMPILIVTPCQLNPSLHGCGSFDDKNT